MATRQVNKQHNFQLNNNTVLWQQSGVVLPIDILDEDNMISDRSDALASQQSIKAYVDLLVTWALVPQWVRDADTNTPILVSSVWTVWHLYIVSVAWSTLLDWNSTRWVWDLLFFANGVRNRVPNTVALTWGTITGTLSDQTDLWAELSWKALTVHTHIINDVIWLQTALDLKANNEGASSVSTTITMLVDTMHGTYASPLTGNLTINITWAIRNVVCTVRHNSGTAPTITWWIKHAGTYEIWVMNLIQIIFDWTQAIYTISPFNA